MHTSDYTKPNRQVQLLPVLCEREDKNFERKKQAVSNATCTLP